MTRPDIGSHTPGDAARYERAQAYEVDGRDRDEAGEPKEFEHAHGPGLVCFKCPWLRARREHLGLVADVETETCDRCADEFPVVAGCLHGQLLCGRCKDYCQDCRDDIADAASDSLRDRLRAAWGGGEGA